MLQVFVGTVFWAATSSFVFVLEVKEFEEIIQKSIVIGFNSTKNLLHQSKMRYTLKSKGSEWALTEGVRLAFEVFYVMGCVRIVALSA